MTRRVGWLEFLSTRVAHWAGSSWAFAFAVATILVWATVGPLFGFSDTWQLVINTSTTIVTFLMVFLIQRSQNKDSLAIQIKLNELIAAAKGASNRLINVEDCREEEVQRWHSRFEQVAQAAKREKEPTTAHSVEEVLDRDGSTVQ